MGGAIDWISDRSDVDGLTMSVTVIAAGGHATATLSIRDVDIEMSTQYRSVTGKK
jgi:hypothetical protein